MTTPTHEEMVKEGWKKAVYHEPKTIDELLTTFEYWLYLESAEREGFEVILAAALDRDIPGDPLWFYVIAPSGGIKTEFLRALSKYERIYRLDSLTAATFISGKMEKDKETGELYPIAGILESLNKHVLVIKDFTVILSDTEITRHAIFGQLRSIYDGYFEKAFGTMEKPIRVKSKIGLIAGVTPVIDKYTKAHSILGERFLKIRLHPNPKETAEKAFKNLGNEERMREDLATATAYYLNLIRVNEPYPKPSSQQRDSMISMAHYVALMRTRVFCRYYHGQIVDMSITEAEIPTRVAKQLKKLSIGLALVRQHEQVTNEDMATVKRVAKDCAIPARRRIIECFSTFIARNALPFEIADSTKLPRNTVLNELDKMRMLGIVKVKKSLKPKNESDHSSDKELEYYAITNMFGELYDTVYK